MSGKTISEKILSDKSGGDARAGDLVICRVDFAMGTDASVPMAVDYFRRMGAARVFDPDRIVFVLDHYADAAHAETLALQSRTMDFAREHGIAVHAVGEGICHQIMVETGRTRPGRLLVGADSHSVTGGALNAFATGIGSSDLAATMICGRIWLKVPETIKVVLTGRPRPEVYPKDIALYLAGRLGADGASYRALEYCGTAVEEMELEDRLVLSNMSVEMGAKAGIFASDHKTARYLARRMDEAVVPVEADSDAHYCSRLELDVSALVPVVARPHAVDCVAPVSEVAGMPVQMVFVGTCTGGRVRDIHQALRVLEAAGGIAPGVQLIVTPASREIEAVLRADTTLNRLAALGATITVPGCGACCGTAGVIPADGVNVVSTANRNFKGRMGNAAASIYLASPASCAAAAATGRITDPRDITGDSR